MNLEIKKMEFADYEQIEENLCKDFDDFWTKESLKQELENKNKLDSHYIVAKQNKEVVGFAGATNIIDEFNIMNIVVKKDKRNMKIGSNLLEEIIKIANKIKCKTITLEVNENNLNAIKLYKERVIDFEKLSTWIDAVIALDLFKFDDSSDDSLCGWDIRP